MKQVRTLGYAFMWLAVPALAAAQAPAAAPGDPMSAALARQFGMVKGYITKAAEKVPEDVYSYKPTPEVRSFGALMGHIANSSYMICSRAANEKSPSTADVEKTMTAKADLVKAVNDALAYCEGVYAKTSGPAALEAVDFFGGKQPKLAVLAFNTSHLFEHYGNVVTYMRLKGMVPPSSEGR